MDLAYSGAATRGIPHFGRRPPVEGVNAEHLHPNPDPDPFNPVPDVPASQAGTVWTADESSPGQSNLPNLAQIPVSHWYPGAPSVPMGLPHDITRQTFQERFLEDHSQVAYVPDTIRLYTHASEGQANEFNVGRSPVNAGLDPGQGLQNLVMGRNSYDATNQPNEVYAGDAPNVGRYRLGVKTNIWGLYETPVGKFGQEAQLRAYTGLSPHLPVDKPRIPNSAPYTPNSAGTTTWAPAPVNQTPSGFALPSESALTDYATTLQAAASAFRDSGRL
jgi:hypothetical protein